MRDTVLVPSSAPAVSPAPSSAPAPGRTPLDPRFAEYRRTGDRRIRNALIEDHRWLATHCARRFERSGEPLDDLVQVATLGLLKAIERFDPAFGNAFSTFAVPTMTGELRRHFRDRTWHVHVPRRAKDLYQTVTHVIDELTQALGRSPSVPEIAEHVGVSPEDALEALEVNTAYRGVPLLTDNEDDPDAERYGADDRGYDVADTRMTVHSLLAVLSDERERAIVRMRFVDGMTQSQIGARLGVSQVQVSRLLRTSLDRMRAQLVARAARQPLDGV